MTWVVVVTQPSREEVAERHLKRSGFRVYLPRYKRILRGSRYANGKRIVTRGANGFVFRPLFPGYLFTEFWESFGTPQRDTDKGVAGVLRAEGKPAFVADELVEAIRQGENARRFDDDAPGDELRRELKAGRKPRVRIDTLDTMVGTLISLDEAGRARVLVERLLGSTITMDVSEVSMVANG